MNNKIWRRYSLVLVVDLDPIVVIRSQAGIWNPREGPAASEPISECRFTLYPYS